MNEEYPDQGLEGQDQNLDAERAQVAAAPNGGEFRRAAEPPPTGDGRGDAAVAGQRAAKAATQVTRDAPISIAETGEPGYVSRGGHKLAGALAVFGAGGHGGDQGFVPPGASSAGLTVAGRDCLDAGASTGGF